MGEAWRGRERATDGMLQGGSLAACTLAASHGRNGAGCWGPFRPRRLVSVCQHWGTAPAGVLWDEPMAPSDGDTFSGHQQRLLRAYIACFLRQRLANARIPPRHQLHTPTETVAISHTTGSAI